MDTLTPERRSAVMRSIKGKWTGPERRLHAALIMAGLDPTTHDVRLPGRPDFVIDGVDIAIMVEGCFWHGCPRHYKEPKSNVAFWRKKVADNVRRDRRNRRRLRALDWSVHRVWEHRLRTADGAARVAEGIKRIACRRS